VANFRSALLSFESLILWLIKQPDDSPLGRRLANDRFWPKAVILVLRKPGL